VRKGRARRGKEQSTLALVAAPVLSVPHDRCARSNTVFILHLSSCAAAVSPRCSAAASSLLLLVLLVHDVAALRSEWTAQLARQLNQQAADVPSGQSSNASTDCARKAVRSSSPLSLCNAAE
jgi:hypothetical protein